MAGLDRREFIKLLGLAGSGAAAGCSPDSPRRLIPYIASTEDVIPGEAVQYATTCRECPAGCGLLARNRDGRAIKAEGNPLSPIGRGALCARGQASLHGLYNPDRFRNPMIRGPRGTFEPISWDKAEEKLVSSLRDVVAKGRANRVFFMTGLETGTLADLTGHWLSELGQPGGRIVYEPFSYEPLRKANHIVFGADAVPTYSIDRADFLVSFNAGFLETWLSNVEFARQFADFHSLKDRRKNTFVFVGPRLSMTAANADLWIPVRPGNEYLVALGMLRVISDEDLAPEADADRKASLKATLQPWPMEKIAGEAGVDVEVIRTVARLFARAQTPLALAEGLSLSVPNALETAVAANLLCSLKPDARRTIDFSKAHSCSTTSRAQEIEELMEKMTRGEVDILLFHDVNPAFSLPPSLEVKKALGAVPLAVSFSSAVDETSELAHLVMPTHTPLESWGDYSPRTGYMGLMQPVMGPVFAARNLGDVLLSTGKKVMGPEKFPWKNFHETLLASWVLKWRATGSDRPFESFWTNALRTGGLWETGHRNDPPESRPPAVYSFPQPKPPPTSDGGFAFTAYPTIQFFDGRAANRPWLQELPDPLTMTTWGGWAEIHPATAQKLGISRGDILRISSPFGTIEAPANPMPTVPPSVVAVPMGQGHTNFGRFADGLPANPFNLFSGAIDVAAGGFAGATFTVKIERLARRLAVAHTDGSFYDHGRELLETVALDEHLNAVASGRKPHLYLPLPEGYDPATDMYPPHEHVDYRWAMVVDVDRCIGCGACVTACYAENNTAVVGREQVLMGREMSWLRIQRYFSEDDSAAHWLPMLCQHCDCAPCEAVCPVYAPHHGKEGLNNQIYNRCFGTRFCSQNDPYKVRRFNYFTYTRPEPLNMQFNPEVTVRQKGVMEKCSFCVQRIVEAKIRARNAGRKVRDGDFTTACAQTCPTGALRFGSLLDPGRGLMELIQDPRTYQVLGHLNTKPAVFYLKKITRKVTDVRRSWA